MAQLAETRYPYPSAATKVSAAQVAFGKGARARAYQLALEATQLDPRNVDAWLLRAWTAPGGLEETLASLSRVITLDPQHPVAQQGMYQSLQRLLAQNGFLAYVSETDDIYYIRTSTGLLLTVPKERAVTTPYPPRKPAPMRRAYHWLALAVLGLAVAGLGTLICAPVAMVYAFRADQQAKTSADRTRAWILMILAVWLCLVAVPLVILFVVHL